MTTKRLQKMVLMVALIVGTPAIAQADTIHITAPSLRARTAPRQSIVGTVHRGQTYTTQDRTQDHRGIIRVKIQMKNGTFAYISGNPKYTHINKPNSKPQPKTTNITIQKYLIVNVNRLNARSYPRKTKLNTVKKGEKYDIINQKRDKKGTIRYQINLHDGRLAYVYGGKNYVKVHTKSIKKAKDNCPKGDYTNNEYDGKCGTKPQLKPTPKPQPITNTGAITTGNTNTQAGKNQTETITTTQTGANNNTGAIITTDSINTQTGATATPVKDNCPNGDHTSSKYDGKCGTKPQPKTEKYDEVQIKVSALRARSKPRGTPLGIVHNQETYKILGTQKDQRGIQRFKIQLHNGKIAYISGNQKYVHRYTKTIQPKTTTQNTKKPTQTTTNETQYEKVHINAKALNARMKPRGQKIGLVYHGQTYRIFHKQRDAKGALWVQIQLHNGKKAYIYTEKNYTTISSNKPIKIGKYDINTDSSLQKFVTKGKPFNNVRYTPNLIKVPITTNIRSKGNVTRHLRPEAYKSLKQMAQQMKRNINKPIFIVSAYRSYASQKSISYSCKRK